MFTSTDASQPPLHVLREIIPIEGSLSTGGSHIDEAISLWFGWHDDEEGLPDWSAFKPFEHPKLLTHISVFRRIDEHYFFVLVGEAVRNWLPSKIQGGLIHEAIPAVNADDVITRSNRALEDRLPNYVEKTMAWHPGHEFARYRALYLPFLCYRDGNDRILTVFDFENELA